MMLRKLFNSPWFVGVLGVGAVVYLGFSLQLPGIGGDASAALVDGDVTFVEDFEGVFTSPDEPGAAVEREAVEWLEDVQRDPFLSEFLAEPPQDDPVPTARKAGVPPPPEVTAIFLRSHAGRPQAAVQAQALVDGELISVGSHVAGYTVERIGSDFVQFRRGELTFKLGPNTVD